jgi:hypothetical protein
MRRHAAFLTALTIALSLLGLVYLVPAAAHSEGAGAGPLPALQNNGRAHGDQVLSATNHVYLPLISRPQLTEVVYTVTLEEFSTLNSMEPTLEEARAGPHVTCGQGTHCPQPDWGDAFIWEPNRFTGYRWSLERMLLKIDPDVVPANVQVDRIQLHTGGSFMNFMITVTMHIGTWTGYGPEEWNSYVPDPVLIITPGLLVTNEVSALRPAETWQAIRNSGGRLFFKTAEIDVPRINGSGLAEGLFLYKVYHDLLDDTYRPSYFRVHGWAPAAGTQ